jgi:hypothetical protein
MFLGHISGVPPAITIRRLRIVSVEKSRIDAGDGGDSWLLRVFESQRR